MKETEKPWGRAGVRLTNTLGNTVWYDEMSRRLKGKRTVHLTPTEHALFLVFVDHPGELQSFFVLNYRLHPDEALPETYRDLNVIRNTMRPAISRLRAKLEKVNLATCLETVHSDGYIFLPPAHRNG